MDETRRGILKGISKLVGGALALSVLPGLGVPQAYAKQRLIWTPIDDPQAEVSTPTHYYGNQLIITGVTFINTTITITGDHAFIKDCIFTHEAKSPAIILNPGTHYIK